MTCHERRWLETRRPSVAQTWSRPKTFVPNSALFLSARHFLIALTRNPPLKAYLHGPLRAGLNLPSRQKLIRFVSQAWRVPSLFGRPQLSTGLHTTRKSIWFISSLPLGSSLLHLLGNRSGRGRPFQRCAHQHPYGIDGYRKASVLQPYKVSRLPFQLVAALLVERRSNFWRALTHWTN